MSAARPVAEESEGLGEVLLELAPRLARLENTVLGGVAPSLSTRQYRTLQRVAQGHTTMTALGRLATVSLPAVSEQVEGLVRRGLLDRATDPEDRRAVRLGLTARGRRVLREADRALAVLQAELVDGLTLQRQDDLANALRHVDDYVQTCLRRQRPAG